MNRLHLALGLLATMANLEARRLGTGMMDAILVDKTPDTALARGKGMFQVSQDTGMTTLATAVTTALGLGVGAGAGKAGRVAMSGIAQNAGGKMADPTRLLNQGVSRSRTNHPKTGGAGAATGAAQRANGGNSGRSWSATTPWSNEVAQSAETQGLATASTPKSTPQGGTSGTVRGSAEAGAEAPGGAQNRDVKRSRKVPSDQVGGKIQVRQIGFVTDAIKKARAEAIKAATERGKKIHKRLKDGSRDENSDYYYQDAHLNYWLINNAKELTEEEANLAIAIFQDLPQRNVLVTLNPSEENLTFTALFDLEAFPTSESIRAFWSNQSRNQILKLIHSPNIEFKMIGNAPDDEWIATFSLSRSEIAAATRAADAPPVLPQRPPQANSAKAPAAPATTRYTDEQLAFLNDKKLSNIGANANHPVTPIDLASELKFYRMPAVKNALTLLTQVASKFRTTGRPTKVKVSPAKDSDGTDALECSLYLKEEQITGVYEESVEIIDRVALSQIKDPLNRLERFFTTEIKDAAVEADGTVRVSFWYYP
jgi:hypothetical protein